jgi:hypothetical protein
MRFRILMLGIAASILATPAYAEERTFEPSSAWNVDYGAESCSLRRTFGTGEDVLLFELQQVLAAPYYNLFVSGKSLRKSGSDTMHLQFGPTELASKRGFLMASRKEDTAPFLIMFGVHLAPVAQGAKRDEFAVVDIGPEREKAITQLKLSGGLRNSVVLKTGSMHDPLQALRTCVTDLTAALGLSEEDQKSIAQEAKISNIWQTVRYIQQRYPDRYLSNNDDNVVRVKLLINPQGEAKACQVANSTRPAVFDDYVCYAMLRVAKYESAKNTAGEPIYSFFTQVVQYTSD